jgi:dTDP-4-amino-4,6-dideoxygalactose transaminase
VKNPHGITKDFEAALCEYTGAPYAVAVTSCTMALTLAVAWHLRDSWPREVKIGAAIEMVLPTVEIPKRTYVGVPYAIMEAGGRPTFRDEKWRGWYKLAPLDVYDSARFLSSGMYDDIRKIRRKHGMIGGGMVCVSFHATKVLGDTQGGAILHDNAAADAWLRRARFDGRTEGVPPSSDNFTLPRAWHCYLSPDVSARLLWHLNALPKHNEPLPNDDYPDLSQIEAFR